MDTKAFEELIQKYPKLEMFIGAGTIGLKTARDILNVDRWRMQEIFQALICCGAVNACGNTSWRATEDCQAYLNIKRKKCNK